MHARLLIVLIVLSTAPLGAADWNTAPSYYSHDQAGQRTAQYAQIGPYYYQHQGDFQRSGYRQQRSTFQWGGSADNLHIVEEWGREVRPYDEWRFPYRPYSAPYPAWGAPYAGANVGGYGGFGPGIGPGVGPGFNNGQQGPYPPQLVPPGNGYVPQQSQDGYWPTYDGNDRSNYYRPYR